jgi:SfnB family sulfur acquisition oxidoreductase
MAETETNSPGVSAPYRATAPAQPAYVIRDDSEALEIAHRFAAQIMQSTAARDRDRILPFAEIEAFSQSGLGAIAVPRSYGGADVSAATLGEVFAIIAAADASIAQIPQNHTAFLELLRYARDEAQRRHFFSLALQGYRFGNALAERGGKTTKDISTKLTQSGGGGYELNGEKFYTTGALFAHFVPVGAVDEHGRLYRVVAERSAPGLTIIDDWSGIGQRTTASGTLRLANVAVHESHIIAVHEFADEPSLYGPVSQFVHVGIDLGIARAALAETVAFVKTRSRPWIDSGKETAAEDPFTIAEIGDLTIRLHAAEAMTRRAGEIIDAARTALDDNAMARASIAVAEAKVLTTEIAVDASSKLFELAGTRAILAEQNLDRHWRNARTHTLHDPVRWKYFAVGNYHLNGTRPNRHAWI